MEDVLHAVDDHRLVGVLDVQDALHAQQVGAAIGHQRIEGGGDGRPAHGLVEGHAEGLDAVVVPVGIVRILLAMAVIMIVPMIMPVSMIVAVPMVVMVPAAMAVFVGLLVQPALHVGGLGVGIVEAGVQDRIGVDLAVGDGLERRTGVELVQSALELLELGGLADIGLGQQQPIGHGGLLHRFLVIVERAFAVHAVDRGHHAVETIARGEQRIGHQRVQDGGGVGEAGRLHHHALERRHLAARALQEQLAHGADEIAAHGAAEATRIQGDHAFVVGFLDQQMVETDLAELVNDHRGVGQLRPAQQLVEEGGLAAAEETRQHGDGNTLLGGVLRVAHGRPCEACRSSRRSE